MSEKGCSRQSSEVNVNILSPVFTEAVLSSFLVVLKFPVLSHPFPPISSVPSFPPSLYSSLPVSLPPSFHSELNHQHLHIKYLRFKKKKNYLQTYFLNFFLKEGEIPSLDFIYNGESFRIQQYFREISWKHDKLSKKSNGEMFCGFP